MSYDYSSEGKQLELPNPYKTQNLLLWLSGVALIAGALLCLWWAREAWLLAHAASGVVPIAVGISLMFCGLWAVSKAASRLRFFFGRKRPRSLAPEIAPGTVGTSPDSRQLQDLLRQGALEYPEPSGPIEGVLYHWVPNLITAPRKVQWLARTQFFNLAALLMTLLSFGGAWLLVGHESVRPWLALGYFLFGFFFLLKPVVSDSVAQLSLTSLVGLIVGAVLGPVAIGLLGPNLPDLHGFSMATQTTVMLLSGVIALAITVMAVIAQVAQPPATQTSAEQLRVSMNVPPSVLMDELDRRLQDEWTERIPNRRYARIEPLIDPARHAAPFAGEMVEETQPMPLGGSAAPGLGAALASPRHRWIAVLDLYATLLVLLAVGFALLFVRGFDAQLHFSQQSLATMGVASILLLVALFCQHAAQQLWGRFDFESLLTWVEFAGTYQTSSIGTGNALRSRVNTHSEVVRIESMTLRVWRARIESVAFDKDGARQITAMFSTEKEAKALASHLAEFGQAQSVMLSPQSAEDRARMAALAGAEQHLALQEGRAAQVDADLHAAAALADLRPAQADEPASLPAQAAHPATRFCPACGVGVAAQARFCSACGTPLTA